MTITQLRYFCTAARCHSITQAAKLLYVTQPAVSIAIRELEKEFSITLFSYTGHRLELTVEGEQFYERAVGLLDYTDDMKAEFSDISRYRPTVKLGIPPMISTVFFPEMMDAFHEEHPEVYLELTEYASVRACEQVQNEHLDIGLVNMEVYNIDKFSYQVLSEDSLVFCVSPEHRLAGLETITLDALDKEPLILFSRDSVQNQLLSQRFHALGIEPHVIMHSSQITTILKFLRQGKCGCFMFQSVLQQFDDIKSIPVDPGIPIRIGLVWKKGKYVSAHTQAFIDFCRRFYK